MTDGCNEMSEKERGRCGFRTVYAMSCIDVDGCLFCVHRRTPAPMFITTG